MSRKQHSLTEQVSMGGQALFSCLAGNGFQNEGSMIVKKKNKKVHKK